MNKGMLVQISLVFDLSTLKKISKHSLILYRNVTFWVQSFIFNNALKIYLSRFTLGAILNQ